MEEGTLEGDGGLDKGEVGEGVVGDVDGVRKVRSEWKKKRSDAFLFFHFFLLVLYVSACELLDEMEGEYKGKLREA